MASKVLTLRLQDPLYEQVRDEAKSVPYRTVTDYVKELIKKDLKRAAKARAKAA